MSYDPDLFSTALKMLASLAVVLGGMFVVFHFMKKMLNHKIPGAGNGLIRVLANHYVGMKKNVSLVEIPGAILVLGITNDNIALLSKIEDKDIINLCKNPVAESMPPSFSEHFQRLTGKLTKRNRKP